MPDTATVANADFFHADRKTSAQHWWPFSSSTHLFYALRRIRRCHKAEVNSPAVKQFGNCLPSHQAHCARNAVIAIPEYNFSLFAIMMPTCAPRRLACTVTVTLQFYAPAFVKCVNCRISSAYRALSSVHPLSLSYFCPLSFLGPFYIFFSCLVF